MGRQREKFLKCQDDSRSQEKNKAGVADDHGGERNQDSTVRTHFIEWKDLHNGDPSFDKQQWLQRNPSFKSGQRVSVTQISAAPICQKKIADAKLPLVLTIRRARQSGWRGGTCSLLVDFKTASLVRAFRSSKLHCVHQLTPPSVVQERH
jgi:hypothetical protein